eukprot:1188561-Prorocentrum_minimum.AAC.3
MQAVAHALVVVASPARQRVDGRSGATCGGMWTRLETHAHAPHRDHGVTCLARRVSLKNTNWLAITCWQSSARPANSVHGILH